MILLMAESKGNEYSLDELKDMSGGFEVDAQFVNKMQAKMFGKVENCPSWANNLESWSGIDDSGELSCHHCKLLNELNEVIQNF